VIDHEPDAQVSIKTGKDKAGQSAVVSTIKNEGAERCVSLISSMLSMTEQRHAALFAQSMGGGAQGADAEAKR